MTCSTRTPPAACRCWPTRATPVPASASTSRSSTQPDEPLQIDNRCYNRLITALRAPTERGHALLGRWRAPDRVTLCLQRIGAIAAAALVLTSLDRGSR